EDAAMAERAGTELGAAFDPSDDAALGQLVGGAADDIRIVAQALHGKSILARDAGHVAGLGAPEGMVGHFSMRPAEVQAVHTKRRPESAASVAGRARNEDARESRFAQDTRVGAAVEGDAATEAEVVEAGLLVEPARQIHHCLFEDALHRAGDVREAAAL